MLLPLTRDTGWFFDTELLILAQEALACGSTRCRWIGSTTRTRGVNVTATILADLRGIARLGFGLLRGSIAVPFLGDPASPPQRRASRLSHAGTGHDGVSKADSGQDSGGRRLRHQVSAFAAVGAASTVAYVLLYLALRGVLPAQWANALSLLVTAVANTAANRRLTFGIRGSPQAGRHQARGLLAFGTGLLVTSAALAWLHAVAPRPDRGQEVAVLTGASLLAALVRFVLYRNWVFRSVPKGHQG